MGKLVLWLAGAAIAAAAGYWGLVAYPADRFRHELDRALTQLPAGYAAQYQAVEYAPIARHATITGLTVRGQGAHRLDFSAERVEVGNLSSDIGPQWSRAAAQAEPPEPGATIRIAGSITAEGVRYAVGAAELAVGRIEIERLDLHPWALLQGAAVPGSALLPFALDRPALPDPRDLPALLRAQLAQVLAVGFHRLALDDVRVNVPDPERFNIDKVALDDYAPGRVRAGLVEGVRIGSATTGTMRVDRAAIRNLDLSRPLARVLAGEPLERTGLDGGKLGRFEYAGVTLAMPNAATASLGTLALSDIVIAQGVPVSGSIALNGLGFSGAQLAGSLGIDALGLIGLDAISLDLAATYDWDLATRRLAVRDGALKLDRLARLDFALDLAEVVPEGLNPAAVRLVQGSLRYADASLAERALAVAAALTGTAPDELRRQLIATLRQLNIGLLNNQAINQGNSPAATAAIAALAEFIREPHSLIVELKPPASLAFGALRDGLATQSAEFFASLGLRVTAAP